MLGTRPVNWSEDVPALLKLDPSFTTDRIYALDRQPCSFALVERSAAPVLRKTVCQMDEEIDAIRKMEHVVVVEVDQQVVGLAAAQFSAWNRRVVL
ncbi:MAG TPA: hypothetical protein VNT01_16245 [Symbiobacteriaceae bacterium]|nr:hypothetical protein [Symbiobacteriaceae bacterium]